jgi:uncharacterized membrane protein
MLPPGVATALAAAVLFGVYLYVYKRYFDVLPATVYTAVNETAGFVWYLPIAAVTWPAGTAALPDATTPSDLVLLGAVGVTIAAANLVSIRALKLGDVSYVAPLNKLVPVFVLPVELLLLTTSIGVVQIGGVVLAVTAIYIANYETASMIEPFRRAATYRPARLALGGPCSSRSATSAPGRYSRRPRSRCRPRRCSRSSGSPGSRCRWPRRASSGPAFEPCCRGLWESVRCSRSGCISRRCRSTSRRRASRRR